MAEEALSLTTSTAMHRELWQHRSTAESSQCLQRPMRRPYTAALQHCMHPGRLPGSAPYARAHGPTRARPSPHSRACLCKCRNTQAAWVDEEPAAWASVGPNGPGPWRPSSRASPPTSELPASRHTSRHRSVGRCGRPSQPICCPTSSTPSTATMRSPTWRYSKLNEVRVTGVGQQKPFGEA